MQYPGWILIDQSEAGPTRDAVIAARLARYDLLSEDFLQNHPCACIGSAAWVAAASWSAREHADLGVRTADDPLLGARIAAAEQAFVHRHPLRDAVDPGCIDCGGRGTLVVAANPDGRFERWEVGGRWSGAFDPLGAGRDVIPVDDLLAICARKCPVAIVDRDGSWHEVDTLWGRTPLDDPDWVRTVGELLGRRRGMQVVVLELHTG